MAVRVAGLDIGTFAVRAAELSLDGERPTLTAFGQVTLPPGAVVGGEVIDAGAVTEAIRRLWANGRFSIKKVRLGVSSQRVIVRQADLPAMSAEDMHSAIQFEAQDLIPIPIEEALLDFCLLGTDPYPYPGICACPLPCVALGTGPGFVVERFPATTPIGAVPPRVILPLVPPSFVLLYQRQNVVWLFRFPVRQLRTGPSGTDRKSVV